MNGTRGELATRFLDKVAPGGVLESLAENLEETLAMIAATNQLNAEERNLLGTTLEKVTDRRELSSGEQFILEAIIIPDKRPVIDIINDDFTVLHPIWAHFSADAAFKANIQRALPSIGRVEVYGIPNLPYGGTGFVVGADLIMTNRHVAQIFAEGLGLTGLVFRPGVGSAVDFKRERSSEASQLFKVRGVRMIHPYWDIALLHIDRIADGHQPLVLSLETPDQLKDREVAVVGYPAFDPRNPADVQNKVFRGIYNVKRLQPGFLRGRRTVESFAHQVFAMEHDASTLGGNSGSAVLDVKSGTIVALHFAGIYLDANFTVPAAELARDQRVLEAGVNFVEKSVGDQQATVGWWRGMETPKDQ
jgi:endonuclease G, mitochondrial